MSGNRAAAANEDDALGVFDHALVGVVLIDLDGHWLRLNNAFCAIVGYTSDELVGRNVNGITHAEDAHEEADFVSQLIAGEIPGFQLRKRLLHKNGDEIWVRVSASAITDESGTPQRLVAHVEDITESMRSEDAHRVVHARLQAIFDNVPAGLSLKDLQGRFLHANRTVAENFGRTPEEMVGFDPSELLDNASLAASLRAAEQEMIRTRERSVIQTRTMHPDGTEHEFQIVRYPVIGTDDKVVALGSFSLDITDRVRAERAHAQALTALAEAQRIAKLGSWQWDPATHMVNFSDEGHRVLGREPTAEALSDADLLESVHSDDRKRLADGLADWFGGGPSFELDFHFVGGDGVVRILHVLGRADPDHAGGYHGTVQDVTELQAQRALRAAEERFRLAFDHAPIGMALVSPEVDGRWLRVNEALCEMSGYSEAELLSRSREDILDPEELEADRERMREMLAGTTEAHEVQTRYIRADQLAIDVLIGATLVRDADGTPMYVVEQIQDVSERQRFEGELRYIADHDAVTGLANRRRLSTELERCFAEQRRHGRDLALIMLDLDHFKYINDTLGHNAGDAVLVAAATALRARLRETDLIARLGGDEFAIILPDTNAVAAQFVARALLADIRELRTQSGDHELQITATAGISVCAAADGCDQEWLMTAADLAMYEAKEAGRDQAALHDPGKGSALRASEGFNWSHRIRRALEADRFVLHYQPIIGLRGDSPPRYEALLRMRDTPNRKLAEPERFLPIAERYGLMPAIDRWVINRVVSSLANGELPAAAHISVNLSASSLATPDLSAQVKQLLLEHEIDADKLCFEVTETAAITRLQDAKRLGKALRRLGCDLALDDFGTGFGSFYHLKYIPYNSLKIDGAFIRDLTRSRPDRAFVKALVEFAHSIGKNTVAEYVTDARTLELVRELGVDYAQGFHTGRPVSAGQVTRAAAGGQVQRAKQPLRE